MKAKTRIVPLPPKHPERWRAAAALFDFTGCDHPRFHRLIQFPAHPCAFGRHLFTGFLSVIRKIRPVTLFPTGIASQLRTEGHFSLGKASLVSQTGSPDY
jgi:hypothetical protein